MKRLLLITLAFLCLAGMAAGKDKAVWPDGSAMDKWFMKEPKGPSGKEDRRFSILDYGARPDAGFPQTEAIQRTIDAAAEAGGGTVVIPLGTYISGSLFFKPHTHLFLCPGAILKGSRDIGNYPEKQVHIEGVLQPYHAALINAYGVDGFTLRSEGVIDGDGAPFWDNYWTLLKQRKCTNLEVRRPRLIYICNSDNVRIMGGWLRDSGFWTLHLYKCSHVKIKDVCISAPMKPVKAPSSDGIDVDGCSDVHIYGCAMATGDDLVVVKGGKGPHADTDPDNPTNARILVEDCQLGHGPGALVFGSECVGARNVILRNCKIKGTERLLWLKMRPDTPQRYEYITVENVTGEVDNVLYVKPWTQFFDLKGEKEIPRSYGSHITIRGCDLKCKVFRRIEEAPDQFSLEDMVYADNKVKFTFNKDEEKVKPYSLEDPLAFAGGYRVQSPEDWKARREEILDIFQREMYGRMPEPSPIYTEVIEEGYTLQKAAVRRQVRMWFNPDHTGPKIDWLVVMPRYAKGPVPAILLLNFDGNHTILADEEVLLPDYPVSEGKVLERGELSRSGGKTVIPLEMILARGYAFVTACYEDVSPDPLTPEDEAQAYTRVFDLWGRRDPSRKDNTSSLAAWAWGLMRGADLIEQTPELDGSKIVLTGCSRLGKAAVVAAAFDERMAVSVINQTGGGGVPLTKRYFGETVASETVKYPHWFCPAYHRYAGEEKKMTFDQHMLLSCIAPRPLLVEGFNNPWFDTHGEFLALKAASPVWEFLGKEGLPEVEWPEENDTSAIGPVVGYVRRHGAHGLSGQDWTWLLDFADKNLK